MLVHPYMDNTIDMLHALKIIPKLDYSSHAPSINKPDFMSYGHFHFPRYHTNVQTDLYGVDAVHSSYAVTKVRVKLICSSDVSV